jgi:vacuolar-type H+-ATPase subunit B/Vma2
MVEKTVKRFANFAEAEKADRDFYKKLTGNERLQILVELLNHAPKQRLERVSRITKLPRG